MLTLEQKKLLETMQQKLKDGDVEGYAQSFTEYHVSLQESIKQDYDRYVETNDQKILQNRGIRQLTAGEKKFYQDFTKAVKSPNYKQEINNMKVALPETIITDVYKELLNDHPLLSKIDFKFTSYATKWIVQDHSKQTAVWGELNEAITTEITSAFKTLNIEQFKLTAFFVISLDMLDLGPEWIDAYIRAVLYDSLANGLEASIVDGTGKSSPIGLARDVSEGVTVTGGVYPRKTAIKLKTFKPKEYGKVLAKLAKTEKGNMRKFNSVILVCNMTDYLTKVMPASTASNFDGTYTKDVFPFPTETIVSNELKEGEAVLFIPQEYFFGLGSSKEGNITYSDEAKFLEDQRAYKIKLYGNGRAYDNTISILLDISELEEFYVTVKELNSAAPAA